MFRTNPIRALQRFTPNRALQARPLTNTFSTTARAPFPRKDDQDKDSVSPRRSENSLTGSDDGVAENSDAAFNPNKTRPEEEVDTAGEGNEHNPLNVSAGNKEVSKPKDEEGQASSSPEGNKGSGEGSGGGAKGRKAGGSKSG